MIEHFDLRIEQCLELSVPRDTARNNQENPRHLQTRADVQGTSKIVLSFIGAKYAHR